MRQLGRMLKCHTEVAHIDPFAASGTANEMVGFAFRNPALWLAYDLVGLHWRWCAVLSFASLYTENTEKLDFRIRPRKDAPEG